MLNISSEHSFKTKKIDKKKLIGEKLLKNKKNSIK